MTWLLNLMVISAHTFILVIWCRMAFFFAQHMHPVAIYKLMGQAAQNEVEKRTNCCGGALLSFTEDLAPPPAPNQIHPDSSVASRPLAVLKDFIYTLKRPKDTKSQWFDGYLLHFICIDYHIQKNIHALADCLQNRNLQMWHSLNFFALYFGGSVKR